MVYVSIITPTYNRAETLPRAAQSVADQTYDSIEYIIIDDGSTDETEKVVKELDIDRLIYKKFPENRGVSEARNKGIEVANGKLICFLDSDDELRETAIAQLVDAIDNESENCAGVFGHQNRIRKSRGEIKKYKVGRFKYEDLLERNYIGGFGAKMFRSDVFDQIGEIDTSLSRAEDYDYFLRITEEGYYFRCIDTITFNRFFGDDQIMKDHAATIEGQKRILDKYGQKFPARHRAERTYSLAHAYAKAGQIRTARHTFGKCIRRYPFRIAYYYYFLFSILRNKGYKFALQTKNNIRRWQRNER